MIAGAATVALAAAVLAAPIPVPRPSEGTEKPALAREPPAQAQTNIAVRTKPSLPTGKLVPGRAAAPPLPSPRPETLVFAPAPVPDLAPDEMACRDPRLAGSTRPTVVGRIPGCAILNPVRITQIAGITLSTAATLDCPTARTFANWLTGIAQPAAREILGRRIERIWIMGSYSCRSRNNRRGARLSEHAAGRALDIGGVTLGDGTRITVLKDWGRGDKGRFLNRISKAACGPFKTVLGPGSNRFHRDHFHFDTAHRRRTYCR